MLRITVFEIEHATENRPSFVYRGKGMIKVDIEICFSQGNGDRLAFFHPVRGHNSYALDLQSVFFQPQFLN